MRALALAALLALGLAVAGCNTIKKFAAHCIENPGRCD